MVALGTCAVYGGIPGAGVVHANDEILNTVYRNNGTTGTNHVPVRRVDALERTVTPLDEAIEVDLYLPGCPPHPTFIFQALLALLEGRQPKASDETVWRAMQAHNVPQHVDRVRKNHEGIPDPDTCLLSQGYVCLGSVTLEIAVSPPVQQRHDVHGLRRTKHAVLTEPNRDIRRKWRGACPV